MKNNNPHTFSEIIPNGEASSPDWVETDQVYDYYPGELCDDIAPARCDILPTKMIFPPVLKEGPRAPGIPDLILSVLASSSKFGI